MTKINAVHPFFSYRSHIFFLEFLSKKFIARGWVPQNCWGTGVWRSGATESLCNIPTVQTLDFSRNNLEKVFFQRDKKQKETAATSKIAAVPFLKREKRERKESV